MVTSTNGSFRSTKAPFLFLFASSKGNSSRRQLVDDRWVQCMLDGQAAFLECFKRIIRSDFDPTLRQDGARVHTLVHAMNGDERFTEAVWVFGQQAQGEFIAVDALVCTGIRRMDVDDSRNSNARICERGKKKISHEAHVSGKDSELRPITGKSQQHGGLVFSTVTISPMVHQNRRDPVPCWHQGAARTWKPF